MVTHYAKYVPELSTYVPELSTLTYPLRRLLQQKTVFRWTAECEASFLQLKAELISDRTLVPYNPDLPVIVSTDASPVGIAGILAHVIDGQERPIAYTSRSLTPAERRYNQLDREALAIVFVVQHFFSIFIWTSFCAV